MKSKKNRSKTKENERQIEPNRCQKQIKWQKWTANLLCFKIWKRAMIIINYISYSRKCYFVSHRTYDRNKTDFHADALETQKSTEKSTEEWPNRIGLCTEREWTKTKQKWSKGEREKNHLEWKNMKEEKRDCAQTKPTKRGKKNGKATGQHKSVQFSWVELTWDSAKRLNRKKRLDTKQNTEYTIRASASASDYSWECLYSLPQYVCVSVARVRTIFRYAKWFKSQTD